LSPIDNVSPSATATYSKSLFTISLRYLIAVSEATTFAFLAKSKSFSTLPAWSGSV